MNLCLVLFQAILLAFIIQYPFSNEVEAENTSPFSASNWFNSIEKKLNVQGVMNDVLHNIKRKPVDNQHVPRRVQYITRTLVSPKDEDYQFYNLIVGPSEITINEKDLLDNTSDMTAEKNDTKTNSHTIKRKKIKKHKKKNRKQGEKRKVVKKREEKKRAEKGKHRAEREKHRAEKEQHHIERKHVDKEKENKEKPARVKDLDSIERLDLSETGKKIKKDHKISYFPRKFVSEEVLNSTTVKHASTKKGKPVDIIVHIKMNE